MFWIWALALASMFIWFALKAFGRGTHRRNQQKSFTLRMGKVVPTDDVFDAWTSLDLDTMLSALSKSTNPIDRHFLLQSIVQVTYKSRKNPKMHAVFLKIAHQHIQEFSELVTGLRQEFNGVLPRIVTFQYLATVLAEKGESDEAIKVCQTAIQYGLHDGTKTGFEGRIKRIRKKQQAVLDNS
ncbi:hypothetical protein MYX82_13160 [Acidobacteria bacterium AH-259-D05]|nr:hypothetical protein [Acidobacteria bacterium AH-259-D05]